MTFRLLGGDCLETLAEIPDASIDAIVTDPPYGLSAQPDAAEVLTHWLAGDDYEHRGGGFMGKSWDSFVPGPKVWAECLRVLKPGGHLAAFFGTRTVDLGGIAIRLAGFEIRDCCAWHYGSGFPKSLDVSKAIDKAAGAEREVVGEQTKARSEAGLSALPTMGAKVKYETWSLTAPATLAAQKWEGWGTALKPAFEPIILARKPLIGTVAENVTRYGTGGLNVDGCRVGMKSDDPGKKNYHRNRAKVSEYPIGENAYDLGLGPVSTAEHPKGRWPANLILDPEAGAMLDAQSGETPSRFFYTAKASRAERNAGLDGFEERLPLGPNGSPNAVGATRGSLSQPRANVHPTVKPIDLMRWLVRLVTPPGGTVLDPFTGSGTTGIAAHLEGFDFTGIEREAEYLAIAEARIKWWQQHEGDTAEILQRAGLAEKAEKAQAEAGQTSLFGEAA